MDALSLGNRRVFAIGLWFRVVCALTFVVFVTVCEASGVIFGEKIWWTYRALGLLVLVNVLYWVVGSYSGFRLWQFYGHWAIDLILISAVIYGLGPAAVAAMVPGYTLIIITSATFISRAAAFVVATGAAIALVALITSGLIGTGDAPVSQAPMNGMFIAGIGVIFFYLFAFLSGTLAAALGNANDRLQRQNLELETNNSALQRLREELEFQTRVLTHDIRGPISAAASFVSLLRSEDMVGDSARVIDMALENLARADEMIDELREMQLSEARTVEKSGVDLQSLCEELVVEFERAIEVSMIQLHIAPDLPTVLGDPRSLRVLFRNLIANAVRYVPQDGTGMIRIDAHPSAEGWAVNVSDNGPGIPAEFRAEVFKPFRKVPGIESRGMGVGLAIATRIVERHGGRILAETSKLGGAELVVILPA